jgi:hypothetical protein
VPLPEPHDWPAVSSSQAATLRDSWYRRSAGASWSSSTDWWDPACDAVVEALAGGTDPRPAARRLGVVRSRLGATVEETMDDVIALWAVWSRSEPPAKVLRAVASGWAETGLEPAGAASCFDPVTGLCTRAHLEARLAELYRSGALGGRAAGYQLVVLDVTLLPAPRRSEDLAWRQVEAVSRSGEALRRVFHDGETLVRLAPSRVGALAQSGPELNGKLGALDALLAAGAQADVAPSVWVESLPRTFSTVPQLLVDLAR